MQIICIDDGSTDDSLRILKKYAEKDKRILVIYQKNSGCSSARNRGIDSATKEYLAFVDSDDVIAPEMYERLIEKQIKTSTDCVVCDFRVINRDTQLQVSSPYSDEKVYKQDDIHRILQTLTGFISDSTEGMCSLCNKLFITRIVKGNNIFLEVGRNYGEDWMFCIEYFMHCSSISFLHEALYYYIHHNTSSLSTKYRPDYFSTAIHDRKKLKKLFPQFDWQSPSKNEEYYSLPLRSALYFRCNCSRATAKEKMNEIYDVCCTLKYYNEETPEKYTQFRNAVEKKNRKRFRCLLIINTESGYCIHIAKVAIKRLLAVHQR